MGWSFDGEEFQWGGDSEREVSEDRVSRGGVSSHIDSKGEEF
jgi:hypothetical protein